MLDSSINHTTSRASSSLVPSSSTPFSPTDINPLILRMGKELILKTKESMGLTAEKEEKNRIRLKILHSVFPKMISQLGSPKSTYHMKIENLLVFSLIELFEEIFSNTKVDIQGIQAFITFLSFFQNVEFAPNNSKRFNQLFEYIKKHIEDPEILNHERIINLRSAINFFISSKDFLGKTIESFLSPDIQLESLGKGKEKEKKIDPTVQIDLCRYMIPRLIKLSSLSVTILDDKMHRIKEEIEQNAFEVMTRIKNNRHLPTKIRNLILTTNLFNEKVQRMLNVYRLRRELFDEQLKKIDGLIENPTARGIQTVCGILSQLNISLKLLDSQICEIKKQIDDVAQTHSLYLSEIEAKFIEEEEKDQPFKTSLDQEEIREKGEWFAEPFAKLAEQQLEMFEHCCVNKDLPDQLNKKSVDMKVAIKSMESFFDLSVSLGGLSEDLCRLNQKVKEVKDLKTQANESVLENLSQSFERMNLPLKQRDAVKQIFQNKYRECVKFMQILEHLEAVITANSKVVATVEKEIKTVLTNEINSHTDLLELWFDEDQTKHIRQKKKAKNRKNEKKKIEKTEKQSYLTLEPAEKIEKENPVLHIEQPMAVRKQSLKNYLNELDHLLELSSFLSIHQPEDASEEMVEEASSYVKDLRFHQFLSSLSIRLLKKYLKRDSSKTLSVFPFLLSRYNSLACEHALTAQLLLKKDNPLLQHNHLALASQLGLVKRRGDSWLKNYLSKINFNVVSHRYVHTSALHAKERAIPLSDCLQLLLSPKEAVAPDVLIELAVSSLQFIERFCLTDRKGDEFSDLIEKELKEIIVKDEGKKKKNLLEPASQYLFSKLTPFIDRLNTIQGSIHRIMNKLKEGSQKELTLAIWKDIDEHALGLKDLLTSIIDFPEAAFLVLHGDAILTRLQFMDEQIETVLHLKNTGEFLAIHNLNTYRKLRDYCSPEEEQKQINNLNIESSAQYPHRHLERFGNALPDALKWRFDAMKLSRQGKKGDLDFLEDLQARKAGFKKQKKNNRSHKGQAVVLHERLELMISAVVGATENRLQSW